MLSKKIACLLLSASILTPAAAAVVETFDSECVEAATNFIAVDEVSSTNSSVICKYGVLPDINGDYKVDIADYCLLRRYINNDGENIKINKSNADLNYDGEVDFLDLLLLKEML